MIVDPQIDNWATADGVLVCISGMEPEFRIADIEPYESFFERHAINWTLQQIRPPLCDHLGFLREDHH